MPFEAPVISTLREFITWSRSLALRGVGSDQILGQPPQSGRALGVEGVGGDATAHAGCVRRGLLVILKVAAGDAIDQRRCREQSGRGRPLLDMARMCSGPSQAWTNARTEARSDRSSNATLTRSFPVPAVMSFAIR